MKLSSGDVAIRSATEQDMQDIKCIASTYFLDTNGLEYSDCIVATLENRIIGIACFKHTECPELHTIAVHPNYRGKGIGALLVRALGLTLCKGQECIYVRTTAPGFFEKVGFVTLENNMKKELWTDCAGCDRFNNCKQAVMLLELRRGEYADNGNHQHLRQDQST
ncbi:GNAT family N-acetyltransferase [uncultured Methanomethylovorans sp.]|uniref:GNAT family N-acetyltransferase n=1 Tax=uncultured Methanomethylovorans sp. TaxID=183759 RepID=UPI00263862CE|nr:GNAT family N-acetyltransferase [uncultured Methanomethylovorans sp.]